MLFWVKNTKNLFLASLFLLETSSLYSPVDLTHRDADHNTAVENTAALPAEVTPSFAGQSASEIASRVSMSSISQMRAKPIGTGGTPMAGAGGDEEQDEATPRTARSGSLVLNNIDDQKLSQTTLAWAAGVLDQINALRDKANITPQSPDPVWEGLRAYITASAGSTARTAAIETAFDPQNYQYIPAMLQQIHDAWKPAPGGFLLGTGTPLTPGAPSTW